MVIENDAYLMQLSCYIHRNPLRAGIVKRLADYRWSSYLAYAYDKPAPGWLSAKLILSQFTGEDGHKLYREKDQKYSREQKRLWEDFRHGLFLGSKKFVARLRKRYLQKEKRDLIVYLIRRTGLLPNEKIGAIFDLTYSSVSHSVRAVKARMAKDHKFRDCFKGLNSQFKA